MVKKRFRETLKKIRSTSKRVVLPTQKGCITIQNSQYLNHPGNEIIIFQSNALFNRLI